MPKPVTLQFPIGTIRAVYQAVTGIEYNQSQIIKPEQCEAICEMLKTFGMKEEDIEAEVAELQSFRRKSYTQLVAFEDSKKTAPHGEVGTAAREPAIFPINEKFGRRVR